MALPRLLVPGATYLVTRRCLERRFRLTPDAHVTRLLDYLIGYAALQTGCEVVAAVGMTNHLHGVIVDPDARLPEFMQLLCSLSARALNVHQGLVGQVWEAGSYSAVRLETPAEIVDKIAYVIANPVAAGLVATPEEWPGLITQVDALAGGPREAARPGYFFRKDGEERRRGEDDGRPRGWAKVPLPPTLSWAPALPPGFAGADDLRGQVRSALRARLLQVRADRRRAGKRGFLGVEALLAQPIRSTPEATEELFRLNPRLAYQDWTRRAQACTGWLAFQVAHREALSDYREGQRDVLFPHGTYRMRVLFGVRCRRGAGA